METASFTSAKDHPYALQIQSDTKAVDGSSVVSGSETGSVNSNFVLLDTPKRQGFYVYNPDSHAVLAGANTGAGISDRVVVAESFSTFLAQKDASPRFMWHFFLDEDVPSSRKWFKGRHDT